MHTNTIDTVLLYADRRNHLPCWQWWGAVGASGYGKVTVEYRSHSSHKYVYEQLVGKVPDGLQLDHLCHNKLCCNPDHLEPVTCKVNMERRAANITHCRKGHALVGDNLYVCPKGKRECKTCRREASKRFYHRR